jgi:trehalose/maltose hydrolase-like predicted phosphorylase
MTPELQRYYEDRFSMMASEGWKELLIDIDNMIVSLNNISVIQDERSLQFKKGELSILTWLKTLKQVSEVAYEELNEKNV